MTQSTDPVHPGHILFDQAMKPLGVSRNKLARDIDVPVGRISDIVAGKRGITPDSALRLGRYFGTSAEMWMQFQSDYDLHVARCSTWIDIEPRVRELQPVDPDAVAPVTARDQHTERRYYPPDEEEDNHTAPIETAASVDHAPSVVAEIDPEEVIQGDASEDGEAKWWSTPIAADDAPPPDQETARAVEIPDPTPEVEATADASETVDEPVERTFTLDVKPSAGIAAASAAEPHDDPAQDGEPAAIEQVFEIDVSPAAAVSHVVTDGDETADIVAAEPEPEPDYDEALADGLDEDAYSGEIPGDAFADEIDEDDLDNEFDDEFDEDFDDAFASEEAEEEEELELVLARTGTDDLASLDPPLGAPGLDAAASSSATQSGAFESEAGGISMDDLRQAQTGGLSPANWSSALETEPTGGVEFSDFETDGSNKAESAAAPDPGALYDVPLPSEVEPAKEGALPPWPPAEDDESLASLDIPEPGKARKLFEYDD